MDDAKLMELIRSRVHDGRLTCTDAHAVAEQAGATLERIGELCEQATPRVKIASCQLGCF
jgi:hypothetical protein